MNRKITLIAAVIAFSPAWFSNLNAQADILQSGNLESETGWSVTNLNTPAGVEPAATWNYTAEAPAAGTGGNLHVTGLSNNSTVQYAIYQKVHLSKDSLYTFDGAFKAISMNNAWCEIYIGKAPEDGADYGSESFKAASFGTWSLPAQNDGSFSLHGGSYSSFAPDTTGSYYFILKMGSTSWDGTDKSFDIIVDDLSLTRERVAPIASFTGDVAAGYAPLTVTFTNTSHFTTSWSWDFGDGTAAVTDENPVHVFNNAGIYTIALTATNELGQTVETKTDMIEVSPPEKLSGGGILKGGNLENETDWQTSFLSTPAGQEPAVTWNYTTDTPAAGQGGCLYVSGNSSNNTVQYAIYQQVHLSADSVYKFNGAFRDLTASLNQFWCEIYIGTEPVDGLDYGEGNTKIAQFSTWDGGCNGIGVNGTFGKDGCVYGGFTPEVTGDYFFVLKTGSTDWEGKNMPFTIVVDEISLTASRTKPYPRFSSGNPVGFPPQNVEFVNESMFGNTWSWDFGDGSSVSTDENPVHSYNTAGSYTVALTATNELGDSTVTKTSFVKINEKPELPKGEMLYGGNMEDPNLWNITNLNETSPTTAVWNYTDDSPLNGEGGSLYLSANALNNQSQYCIWQKVELNADSSYNFNAAFKAVNEISNFWAEVFIGTQPPVDGEDYGADSIKIAMFSTWAECSGVAVDGTYQADGCILMPDYSPKTTGTYYFAIKVGCIDWENNPVAFEVLIDEVTLKESTNIPKPTANFFTDITSGDAPLIVFFTDLSENSTEWHWDFGDGETSTEQSPSHTYTAAGTYTVTMVAINQTLSDTLVIENLIEVTGTIGIAGNTEAGIHVYPNPSKGTVRIAVPTDLQGTLTLTNILGAKVFERELHGNEDLIILNIRERGLYFINVSTKDARYIKKLIVD